MSHELRTPMNAILGYSEMLVEEAEDLNVKQLIPDLHKIRGAGKHLLSLINDILDLSKIEAGKMTLFVEEIDVASIVDDVATTIQPLIEKNSNKLEIDLAADCGRILADVTKIRQTLLNLLGNASKFTERGRITLSVRRIKAQLSSEDAQSAPQTLAERVQFSITDTGIGMTAEQQGKLFKPFSQTDASTTRKYGGTGLGLAISRRFCQLMGGDISVKSEFGHGSTFTVDLPVSMAETTSELALPARERPSNSFILLVDDNHDTAEMLKGGLSGAGYSVTIANNGKAGLDIARNKQPSAIALHVTMPQTDGWSVLTTLKSDPKTTNIPVIIVAMLPDGRRGFALGASEFLTKPVDPGRFREIISAYCQTPTGYTLVVENEILTRQLLCRILEEEGIRVRAAENASVALEQIEAETPALILLDLMVPGLDAFEFMRISRQDVRFAKIPIVVVTAKDFTERERNWLARSVQCVLSKSALPRERLVAEITTFLGKHAGQ